MPVCRSQIITRVLFQGVRTGTDVINSSHMASICLCSECMFRISSVVHVSGGGLAAEEYLNSIIKATENISFSHLSWSEQCRL